MTLDQIVYAWTEDLFPIMDQHIFTLDEVNDVLFRIWAVRYPGEDQPIAKGGRSESRAETDGRIMHLPMIARSMPVILHELSHIIELREGRNGSHGPDFMKTVIGLYSAYLPLAEDVLLNHARLLHIEVSE